MKSNVAESTTCTIKYFNEASVLYMFLTLDIREINDIRLFSRPIHAPNHELEYTDTNTSSTQVINKRILVELLGIREESVMLYLWGMNPLAHLAYFSILKLFYYVLVYGFWLFHVSKCISFREIRIVNNTVSYGKLKLTFKNRASYIKDGLTANLQMLHFIYFFSSNISTEYFKHAAHSPFFSSKCHLFHCATFFGSCIIHILHTGCAKI
jgi:hypothetical protein